MSGFLHCSFRKKLNKLGLTGCTTLFRIENRDNLLHAPTLLLIEDLMRTLLHAHQISFSSPLHGAQLYKTTLPQPFLLCYAASAYLHLLCCAISFTL